VALSLALGDRVQVKSAPDIGSSLSEPVLVERISHTFDATRATWVTEFALSPLAESGAGTQAPWVLGVTGTLGTDTIPVY
jgi:hypothetical protein